MWIQFPAGVQAGVDTQDRETVLLERLDRRGVLDDRPGLGADRVTVPSEGLSTGDEDMQEGGAAAAHGQAPRMKRS